MPITSALITQKNILAIDNEKGKITLINNAFKDKKDA